MTSKKKSNRGGPRTPGPGKNLGRPPKPEGKKYKGIYVKLPPELLNWMAKNTDNRNGFIVEAIQEKIDKLIGEVEE